jgi:hypothetical protein
MEFHTFQHAALNGGDQPQQPHSEATAHQPHSSEPVSSTTVLTTQSQHAQPQPQPLEPHALLTVNALPLAPQHAASAWDGITQLQLSGLTKLLLAVIAEPIKHTQPSTDTNIPLLEHLPLLLLSSRENSMLPQFAWLIQLSALEPT